jgi:hypothetical protein
MDEKSLSRSLFRHINRLIIVPAFKMGFGKILSNPLTGRIMVLKIKGRKTGRVYYAPVSHAIFDGRIYCYQGKRLKGQWYLNLMADPKVEVFLPKDHLSGLAEEVTDPSERTNAMRQILKSSGIEGFIYGFNPRTASDGLIQEKTRNIHVVRITPSEGK